MTTGTVYAVDINPELLEAVQKKVDEQQLENLVCVQAQEDSPYAITDSCADLVMLILVLHELSDKVTVLHEVQRMLKPGGRLAVVEFKKAQTPYGPPLAHRISEQEILECTVSSGFTLQKRFSHGENFDGYLFTAE